VETKSLDLDAAWRMYAEDRLSLPQVGRMFGVSASLLRYRFVRRGYLLRGRAEGLRLAFARKQVRREFPRGDASPHWRGGRRKSSQGYIEVFRPDHPKARPNGYVFEHRIVWEQQHGPLPDGWHIHHVNGTKDDNRSENLVGMPARDHMRYISMQSARIYELEGEVRRLSAELDALRSG
jgi:hypothetical protein